MTEQNLEPAYGELADEFDELDWDREAMGPMMGYAVGPEEEVVTVPYVLEDE